MKIKKLWSGIALAALLLGGCSSGSEVLQPAPPSTSSSPAVSPPPEAAPDGAQLPKAHTAVAAELLLLTDAGKPGPLKNYYWENGKADFGSTSLPATGQVSFEADEEGRSGVAQATLTYEMFAASRGSRQGAPLDPPDWPSANPIVPVTYSLNGRTYNGYFWNRSHSVGDSLAGEASYSSPYNFTSGTRQQNVGADQSGGMRAAEKLVEEYWASHPSAKTTVAYRVTPIYHGAERFPRGSVVNIKSSEGELDVQLVIINAAEGYKLNYNDGSMTSEGNVVVPSQKPSPKPTPQATGDCTKTSTGNCIKPGQTCPKAAHKTAGKDAAGNKLVCSLYESGTWHWRK